MNKPIKTRNVFAFAVVLTLMAHVALAFTALMFPRAGRSIKVLSIYQRYILSGPYFSEKTVRSSHHLYVAYKHNGQWVGEKDYAQEDFESYCRAPWRYDKLHLRQYPLYLAWQLAQRHTGAAELCASGNFTALKGFTEQQWLGHVPDSISFRYCTRSYDVESSTYSVDTIFLVKCKAR